MTMTAENVVIPEAFKNRIDADKLAELRQSGAMTSNPLPIDKLELKEVGYGDHVLGTLTQEECELYSAYHAAAEELEDIRREVGAGFFQGAAEAIRNKTEDKYNPSVFVTDDLDQKGARLSRRVEYLKSMFMFMMCEKYNCHEYKVGVRSGRRFVKNKKLSESGQE